MVIVIFRSKLTAEAGADFQAAGEEMMSLARQMPGFRDYRSYNGAGGERLTLVYWDSAETLEAWRRHPDHARTQQKGREKWYEYYDMEVAEVLRESHFEKEPRVAREDKPAFQL
ncbi:MAG: antibiotic biosynthesis monooxygenase [Bryobacteraceae bacterium]|nr:antibiotic biosynthesis monooxygenase [Bryobacteraceae bacterium]